MAILELLGYEYKPAGKADKAGKKEAASQGREKKAAAPKAEAEGRGEDRRAEEGGAKKAPARTRPRSRAVEPRLGGLAGGVCRRASVGLAGGHRLRLGLMSRPLSAPYVERRGEVRALGARAREHP